MYTLCIQSTYVCIEYMFAHIHGLKGVVKGIEGIMTLLAEKDGEHCIHLPSLTES